jgi:hypothetical protein
MKVGGLYRRETPDATPELVERTMPTGEQVSQQDTRGDGSEGLDEASGGLQATAPQTAVTTGDGAPQAPAAEAGQAEPSAPALSQTATAAAEGDGTVEVSGEEASKPKPARGRTLSEIFPGPKEG